MTTYNIKKITSPAPSQINNWHEEDGAILQKTLGEQIQKHFQSLLQSVPSIKSIEWTSSQEDECAYDLIYFQLIKNNGYTYTLDLYANIDDSFSSSEFNSTELEIIYNFINYLKGSTYLSVSIFGNQSFFLRKE